MHISEYIMHQQVHTHIHTHTHTHTHTHKHRSQPALDPYPPLKAHKQTQTMHIYIHGYMTADTFMQTPTHTYTGAFKDHFMTLMNGFWTLYPLRWVQKWGISGCGEAHTHIHTPSNPNTCRAHM